MNRRLFLRAVALMPFPLAANLLLPTASFVADQKPASSGLSLPSDDLPIVGQERLKRSDSVDAEMDLDGQSSGKKGGAEDPIRELAEIEEKIRKGNLPKIQFNFDSATIRTDSYPTLDAIVKVLQRHPTYKVLISAHTCTMGSAEYNFRLSLRRAKSVKGYLVKKGIPPPSIRFRGKGFSEPIADNKTEEGREKNRRVEFQLLHRSWPSIY